MAFDIDRRARLGRGLKIARRKLALTCADAARLISTAGVRCSEATLMAWERGRGRGSREPFASDLSVIARVYGCRIDDLCECNHMNMADKAESDARLVG